MKLKTHWATSAAIAGGLLLAGGAGFLLGRTSGTQPPEAKGGQAPEEIQAVAQVRTTAAKLVRMEQTVIAYGTVQAAPEDRHVVGVPYECRVRRVLVAPGQLVAAGQVLLELAPSVEASLQLDEARSAVEGASLELAQVQRRFELKLATSQERTQAQQALRLAKLRLTNLERRRIGSRRITAHASGVVSKVDAVEGQIVPAGAILVELVAEDRVEVKLGVEPDSAQLLQAGQTVHLVPAQIAGAAPIDGQVRLVTQRVNPVSHFVDVFVSLPPRSGLLLDAYVRGQAVVASRDVVAVPRSAVLPEGGQNVLYTIGDNKAHRLPVQTGLRDERQVEILGGLIQVGQAVVSEGNYELADGMPVAVEANP